MVRACSFSAIWETTGYRRRVRRSDAREAENVRGHHPVGLTDERVSVGHIDAERAAIDRPREPAFGTIAIAFVSHPVIPDLGMFRVRLDLEKHVVTEIEAPGRLESVEDVVGGAQHAQIDVLGGPSPGKANLKNQTAFERYRVAND